MAPSVAVTLKLEGKTAGNVPAPVLPFTVEVTGKPPVDVPPAGIGFAPFGVIVNDVELALHSIVSKIPSLSLSKSALFCTVSESQSPVADGSAHCAREFCA